MLEVVSNIGFLCYTMTKKIDKIIFIQTETKLDNLVVMRGCGSVLI